MRPDLPGLSGTLSPAAAPPRYTANLPERLFNLVCAGCAVLGHREFRGATGVDHLGIVYGDHQNAHASSRTSLGQPGPCVL
jgi:hypothetical protein